MKSSSQGPGAVPPPQVLTVGSANAERITRFETGAFRLGQKHTVRPSEKRAGGSAINYACRLLAAGVPVRPVAPIFEDETGREILGALRRAADAGQTAFSSDCVIRGARAQTPITNVFTSGRERTVVAESSDQTIEPYHRHAVQEIARWSDSARRCGSPAAVMIGHIHADRDDSPGWKGAITQQVATAFSETGAFVYANLGRSQYDLGIRHFEATLRHLDVLQLEVSEAKAFCRSDDADAGSLREILERIARHCTVVLTMERIGALAMRKGSRNTLLAWPCDLASAEIEDTTGAGDAFAAGLVFSVLREGPIDSDEDLASALEVGRTWGAYACTTVGGASDCPDRERLEAFAAGHRPAADVEILGAGSAEAVDRLLDRVFR